MTAPKRKRGASHKESRPKRVVLDLTGRDVPSLSPAQVLAHGTTEEVLSALEVIGAVLKNGRLPFDSEAHWLGSALESIGRLALKRGENGKRPCDNRGALGSLVLRELGLSRKTRVSPNETLAREWIAGDLVRQGVGRSDALSRADLVDLQTGDQGHDEGEKAAERLATDIKRLKAKLKAPTK